MFVDVMLQNIRALLIKLRWLWAICGVLIALYAYDMMQTWRFFHKAPIIADLPAWTRASVETTLQVNKKCQPWMNAGDFHLDHNASVEFSKRLDLKFPDGTPESKVEQELRAQDFQKDDVLTKVSAADYSDKVVAYIKPRPSEEWTAAMVDSIIAEAKMREVKMTKHYSFTRSGLISENTNWNVSWRLDGNGNVSNVHGCVIKSLDAI